MSRSKGRAVQAAETQNQPGVEISTERQAVGQEDYWGPQGSKAELTQAAGLLLPVAVPGDSSGHPRSRDSSRKHGDRWSFLGCFGKRTCITWSRGLGQILLPTVVAWRTRQAAVQALGHWVWVVVAPRAGELGGIFGA